MRGLVVGICLMTVAGPAPAAGLPAAPPPQAPAAYVPVVAPVYNLLERHLSRRQFGDF
jgi:hypothetical protein